VGLVGTSGRSLNRHRLAWPVQWLWSCVMDAMTENTPIGGQDGPLFAEGSTAVRRDTLGGKIWSATPHRVVRDSGSELVLACWPGVEMLGPTTWIQWLLTGDDAVRKQAIPNLAAGRWELGRWTWRDTTLLSHFSADDYFSVQRYFGGGHRHGRWYVNFERPYRRTRIGIDTFDLLLDLRDPDWPTPALPPGVLETPA
jgi:hypothetical protein